MDEKQNSTAMRAIIAIVILGAIVGGTLALSGGDDDASDDNSNGVSSDSSTPTQQTNQPAEPEQTGNQNQDSGSESEYVDGTYSAVGSYTAPPGTETVGVTITLENGEVSNVEIENQAEHPTSVQFQSSFSDGIGSLVIGQDIDDVEVDQVSGSSLTSGGFNDALAQIREQAS